MCVLKALKVMFGAFYFLISLLLSSYLADQQLHRGDIVRTLADDSTVVSAESAESTTEESKAALRASWRVGTCADVPGTGLAVAPKTAATLGRERCYGLQPPWVCVRVHPMMGIMRRARMIEVW